jgi:phosphatidate cytidylyltransferase
MAKYQKPKETYSSMLAKRVLVAVILLPIGLALIFLGGWAYTVFIALVLGLAAVEFARLFRLGGYQPSTILVVGMAALLALVRYKLGFALDGLIVSMFILLSMVRHLVAYERGRDQAATDFAITIAGGMYLGFIGAYLVSLRNLPEGMWWVLLALPAVWLADSGAYFIGRSFGRHKMSKRLSPKKSWEGYFGGILVGTVGTALLALLWQYLAHQWPAATGSAVNITPINGAILGFILSVLPTLGDLGESMIKRQFAVKDSGTLLPGHGGVFDRIDSWLWAGVIGFYIIVYFLL